ncbi:hypothetical protein C8R47DRAFT_719645 [Mycena vitilis]|nr:hypothetical protein C8R47DRAFT_719645 [Mycena vitilis]
MTCWRGAGATCGVVLACVYSRAIRSTTNPRVKAITKPFPLRPSRIALHSPESCPSNHPALSLRRIFVEPFVSDMSVCHAFPQDPTSCPAELSLLSLVLPSNYSTALRKVSSGPTYFAKGDGNKVRCGMRVHRNPRNRCVYQASAHLLRLDSPR